MKEHVRDSDCTVDEQTGCCTECGVDHSGPTCAGCDQRAFHAPGCPFNEEDQSRERESRLIQLDEEFCNRYCDSDAHVSACALGIGGPAHISIDEAAAIIAQQRWSAV